MSQVALYDGGITLGLLSAGVPAVLIYYVTRHAPGRFAGHLSPVLFLVSVTLPALQLGDCLSGWQVFLLSFSGPFLLIRAAVSDGMAMWYVIACCLGAVANILFWFGYACFVRSYWSPSLQRRCLRLARLSTMIGFGVLLPLLASGALGQVFLGYGLWVGCFLLLARASRPQGVSGPDQEKTGSGHASAQGVGILRGVGWRVLVAVFALVCLAGIVKGIVAMKEHRQLQQERTWVAGAEVAVEAYLRQPPEGVNLKEYGAFQNLDGSGYSHPVWNINAPHLIAQRQAHFSKATVFVQIYVWEPDPHTSPLREWMVEKMERSQPGAGSIRIFARMR